MHWSGLRFRCTLRERIPGARCHAVDLENHSVALPAADALVSNSSGHPSPFGGDQLFHLPGLRGGAFCRPDKRTPGSKTSISAGIHRHASANRCKARLCSVLFLHPPASWRLEIRVESIASAVFGLRLTFSDSWAVITSGGNSCWLLTRSRCVRLFWSYHFWQQASALLLNLRETRRRLQAR